ncbi:MAG TPA: methyltransferase domain-containing protein, partial [Thermoanaerobaculia bacterium]
FANPGEASPMLINLGVLLSGMRLVQGHTVLDFGAGTGWLSRSLAQMGCRMIVMDVSPTALRVAEEHFGEAAHRPRFVLFDGYTIDLPDESVDRIVCFDAFHHVPNPDRVLRELGRVLKPGGLAAFSEPGPHHSKSALSQFEMRTYGVLENDVDIHAIWNVARECGFADLHLAAFSGTPPRIRLEQFDELLRGGDALLDAADEMRKFLQNVRIFYLQKAGTEEVDSRTISALACRIEATLGPVRSGEPIAVTATVVNTGSATWLPADTKPGGVSLGCHLYSRGALVQFDYHWQGLADRPIAPGEEVRVEFRMPPLPPGEYDLEFDCVANEVTWFAQVGSTPCRLSRIRVA